MYKVLIVDDEQLIRSGMIARFQYLNFKFERIREAASGVEALALLEKEPADIVITDIKMPDMDGMTLIREANFPAMRSLSMRKQRSSWASKAIC